MYLRRMVEYDLHPVQQKASFQIKNGLLYLVVGDRFRLCIPKVAVKNVLELVHDRFHFDNKQTLYELDEFCIPRLSKHWKNTLNIV
jgi:hypothetical protein